MSQILVTGEAKIRDIQGPVVANSGVITALDGAASQYVRGDGTLADFPTSTGGGSSVSYYLNSSVSQGTIGGVAYRQLGKTPISGAGTDITISANGYVASYITDANDPALLEVPAGNFNCEFYFSVNSNNHNPYVYAEVYKYDGTTFTLIGSSQSVPEYLTNGTTLSPYYFAIPVTQTTLAITDRIAIRIYVNVDGRTVTLHTENNHLCQVVTTFSKGLTSLNNLTRQVQFLATGTSGTDFNISSVTATHTFNLPIASATNTGKLSSTDWSTFNNKLSTATAASTYVPYTGANANVDLGTRDLSSRFIYLNGTGTIGGNLFLRKDVDPGFTLNYTTLYSTDNNFGIGSTDGTNTKKAIFSFGSLTDNTLRTYTLPDISGTLALLEGSQTFTGAKTFSLDITVNSLTIGRGAGAIASNTVVGASALPVNTTGTLNTAIGNFSLLTNTTGYGNTSVGHSALAYNTTGFFNAAIGVNALLSNTTGTYNNALGTASLYNNTTGSNNTAVGQVSGTNNTTGSNNTYIGFGSGGGITTGSNNTIIGQFTGTAAMANNIVLADGAGNVRYRYDGTNNNLYGNVNFSSTIGNGTYTYTLPSATGTLALTSNLSAYLPLTGGTLTGALGGTSATFSSSVTVPSITNGGSFKMDYASNASSRSWRIISDSYNFGDFSIQQSTTQAGSTYADRLLISASGNVGIGTSSPLSITNGTVLHINGTTSGFLTMGYGGTRYLTMLAASGYAAVSTTGAVPLVFETNETERMRITSAGRGLFGTTTASLGASGFATSSFQVQGEIISKGSLAGFFWENRSGGTTDNSNWYGWYTLAGTIFLYNGAGNIASINAGTGIYTPLSDINKKKDFEDSKIGLNAIMGLKPTLYRMKSDETQGDKELGFIAQEVKEFIPQAYVESEDFIGLNYNAIVAALVKSVQEQQAQIEELKAMIAAK
jgi:hypothetical protein